MKYRLRLVPFLFLLFSCGQEASKPPAKLSVMPTDTLTYMHRQLLRTYTDCSEMEDHICTRASLDYLLITGGIADVVRKRINRTILNKLMGDTTSLEGFLDGFLNEYHEYVESDFEFMDEEPGWFYEGDLNIGLNDSRILTLAFHESTFKGGAHGSYHTSYWHFNCYTGTLLGFNDLIEQSKKSELLKIGEDFFRKSLHVDQGGSINETTGFYFPQDQFYLPPVFALLPDGLTFTYETYEIASFADGEISFSIPYSALKEIVKAGSILEGLAEVPPFHAGKSL